MRVLIVLVAALWHAATAGIWAEAAPDYPTFAAALQDQKNSLSTFYLIASSPYLANASTFLNDPNNNAILLAVPNSAVDAVIKKYNAGAAVNTSNVRPEFEYLTIPQPPGTKNTMLNLTDGITLNTALTTSTEFGDATAPTQTLTTLTFRDEGQGRWYVGGSPPGVQLDISRTLTCGAGRLYFVDALPILVSKPIATANSPSKLLSVAEALQPENVPSDLSTYAELALADASTKAMFSDSGLTITLFAPSNQAWSDYLASQGTSLAAFKGSKDAHDVLMGCMAVQRPYMVSQFPEGVNQVADSTGRTFRLVSDGNASDDNPQAQLMSNKITNLLLVTDCYTMMISYAYCRDDNPQAQLMSSRTPRMLSILPAPARNLIGGKSIIHGIDGVLIPEQATASAGATTPGRDSFGTPAPSGARTGVGVAAAGSSSSDSASKNVGLIVGVVVGGCVAAALLALTLICVVKKHTAPGKQSFIISASKDSTCKDTHMNLPGVHHGIFTRVVAHEFQWTDYTAISGKTVSVEAGITDTQLDQMLKQAGEGPGERECPVIQLTKDEVKEQLQLLKHGILGKGATAMVFQCLWPSRTGPDALLAAKVLTEGSDANPQYLQSFAYEASVLSSLLHANVVRLYGYCLEPPTVVLILELLPTSLKRMLYGDEPSATRLTLPSITDGDMEAGQAGLLTAPSTQLPAQISTTEIGSSTQHSSPQQQTGMSEASSLPSQRRLSGTPQHLSHTGSKRHAPPSTTASDAEVILIVKPTTGADRKLTMRQVLTITSDIAAGLAFMHDRAGVDVQPVSPFQEPSAGRTTISKVVHRDLKPANILINSRGRAKISDFGLARQHQQTTIGTAHLGAGTLPYMAPELLAHAAAGPYAHASATNRVDIYSLAMIMWEQLAGQPPWQGSADAALVVAVTQGRRPPLPEPPTEEPQLHPDLLDQPASLQVLPQLNAVVRACWRQRELKRPTATAILHELNSLLSKLGETPIELTTSAHIALSLFPALSGAPTPVVELCNRKTVH